MELKVLVEGFERSVSGVTESTTCSQIIYALAHATSQRGRFVMVEKFRNVERRLAPSDRPLETLRKWRDHAASVTFLMKKIEDDEAIQKVEESLSLVSIRNHSSSSMASTATAPPAVRNGPPSECASGQRSNSSLPPYSTGTLTRRPPPPDYKMVMEQKRNESRRTERPLELYVSDFTEQQLNEKRKQIEKQLQEEELECTASEMELRQLLKQQENLRSILKPMLAVNWPQQYQQEVKRSHKLRASIEATREAVDKTRTDVTRLSQKEKDLLLEMSSLQDEESLLETSIELNSSSNGGSPQKLAV